MLKAAREMGPVTLFCGLLLLAFEALLAYILPAYQEQFAENIGSIAFVRQIVQAMVGAELAERLGPELFTSIPWVHPAVLALVWAHAIVCCTQVPVGEVDRGTIDVTLGLPVSRWQLQIASTVTWILAAAVVLLLGVVGNALGGSALDPAARPAAARQGLVVANLLCLSLATGALAWLVSAVTSQRGRAITGAFAVVLASFLLNYLAPFWEPADRLSFLSALAYYRPVPILRDGTWPLLDMAVLLCVAAALWTMAGVVFARRDLCTV